jgi:NAD+ kinase
MNEASSMHRVGVLANPRRPDTRPVADAIAAVLGDQALDVWACHQPPCPDDLLAGTDLVVAIGGDGAMLHAARLCAPHRIPILGVNMGRLGFLTEVQDQEAFAPAFTRILAGDCWIEARRMLAAEVLEAGQVLQGDLALNDVVLSGDVFGRMVQLDTYIDGGWTTTYNADALIVASATGSTAYALSVGGPILPPDLENILIVPSAPHLSMERPIVLSEGATVCIEAARSNRNAVIVTLDGQVFATLRPDQQLRVRASQHTGRFVRLRERNYFYRSLLDRLEPRINHRPPRPQGE